MSPERKPEDEELSPVLDEVNKAIGAVDEIIRKEGLDPSAYKVWELSVARNNYGKDRVRLELYSFRAFDIVRQELGIDREDLRIIVPDDRGISGIFNGHYVKTEHRGVELVGYKLEVGDFIRRDPSQG